METLERADIENIEYGGHDSDVTAVRGYQNYIISDHEISAISNPSELRPWTDTKIKSDFFKEIINDLKPTSYADFGCNLGYYVFLSGHAHIPSVGIDYNMEYIGVCQSIKARHKLRDTNFKNTNLEDWCAESDTYDLLTVFNVIHHLYNRTEKYKDMNKLVSNFASKSNKHVLFEFPTERDKKGHKWTIDTDYTEKLFVESVNKNFSSVKKIPGQTLERPYYLCTL
jgi:trans-aconitate methyltransferase